MSLSSSNLAEESGLVKTSVHWSKAGRCTIESYLAKTCSLTKNTSISICFVLLWNTGLCAMDTPFKSLEKRVNNYDNGLVIRVDWRKLSDYQKICVIIYVHVYI